MKEVKRFDFTVFNVRRDFALGIHAYAGVSYPWFLAIYFGFFEVSIGIGKRNQQWP